MNNYPLVKFDRGLDQQLDKDVRQGLSTCSNLSMEKVGSLRSTKADDNPITYGSPVHSLHLGGLTKADALLAGVGTTIKRAEVSIATGFSGERIEFASQNGIIYFTNTTDGLWYYNGTGSAYRAGALEPTVGSFAAADGGGAGIFDGIYSIYCVFVNRNGYEGNASDAIATADLAVGSDIDLTDIPVNTDSDYDIIYRRIYIQGGDSGGAGYYTSTILLKTILDNTTTSVSAIAAVEDSATTLSTDNNTAPSYDHIFEHYGVMWLLENQTARFAKTLSPEQWPATQSLNISRSGDPMQRGISWNGAGYIVTRKKVFEVIGSPGSGTLLTNFFIKETNAEKGTIAPMSVVGTPYGMFYQAEDGIMVFQGNQSKIFSHEVEDFLNDRNKLDTIESLSVAEFYDDKLVFSFASKDSSVPDTTLIYDFDRKVWTSENRGYRSLSADRKTNVLYCGTAGTIDRFRNGTTYKDWSMSKEFVPQIGTDANFGKFRINMQGSCTANVYLDDELKDSYSLESASKGFVEERFPLGLAERTTIELVGDAKGTQDVIYEISYSAQPNDVEV